MAYILVMHPGNRLRELRKSARLSQGDLAKAVGLSQSAISQMENGIADIGLEWMRRFARALGCTPADLLADQDNPARLSDEEFDLIRRFRAAQDADRDTLLRVSEAVLRFEPEGEVTQLPSANGGSHKAA